MPPLSGPLDAGHGGAFPGAFGHPLALTGLTMLTALREREITCPVRANENWEDNPR